MSHIIKMDFSYKTWYQCSTCNFIVQKNDKKCKTCGAIFDDKVNGMQPSGNHLPDEWVAYAMGEKPRPKESK